MLSIALILYGMALRWRDALGEFGEPAAVPTEGAASIGDTSPGEAAAPKYAALTFDDGPHRGTTDRLLDGLAERGARATFFLIGEQIEENRDLVERMRAEGHQVGNHTWSHRRLEGMTREELAREVGRTDTLLRSLLGEGVYYLRPPYGAIGEEGRRTLWMPLVKWSLDPRDWESRDRAAVVEAVRRDIQPGDIVILHDLYPSSVDAALDLIDELGAEGWRFVTVEELLAGAGVVPVPGEVYSGG